MYRITLDETALYYPGDTKNVLLDATLNVELNTAGTLVLTCPKENPCYEKFFNRKSVVSVYRDEKEIFTGEVREQENEFLYYVYVISYFVRTCYTMPISCVKERPNE